MKDLDAHINTLPAIAKCLGRSIRTVYRLKSDGDLNPVLMRKTVKGLCKDGKYRAWKIYYTTGRLLLAWQVGRGGVHRTPRIDRMRVKKSPGF